MNTVNKASDGNKRQERNPPRNTDAITTTTAPTSSLNAPLLHPARKTCHLGQIPERSLLLRNLSSAISPNPHYFLPSTCCCCFFFSTFSSSALLICGNTPPNAIVARINVSNSSSPLIANCKCLGVILLTFKSFAAFPASSRTSAVRYSRTAVT